MSEEYSEYDVRRHSNPDSSLLTPMDVFECQAIPVPPGTKAPPREPVQERELATPADEQPAADVSALVAQIESALGMIHAALAEIKRLQAPAQSPPAPRSKAG